MEDQYGSDFISIVDDDGTEYELEVLTTIEYNGWQVEGNWLEWNYAIMNGAGYQVASVSKEIWNWTDTYVIDVPDPRDALCALMLVLAIDAEKCSRRD